MMMAQRGNVVFVIFLSCYLSEILSYASGASPCEDHHPRCGHWASKGECKKNVKWMSKHCRSTCGLCAQANVHDLYKQAKLEIHGAFFLFFGIVGIVVIGAFTKIHFEGPSCPSSAKMTGKTVVITGGNTGIGKETARILAWRKARVIIGCRNITKGLHAAAEIIENTGNRNIEVKKLDLSCLKSVRRFAEEINEEEQSVDVLINNAGYFGPYCTTVDGLENTIQVNYLSHFLLSHLLLDKLKASSPSRIINVSSRQHAEVSQIDVGKVLSQKKEGYGTIRAYNNSKLCQVLSTIEMSKRIKGSGVTVNALHPGVVGTEITRNFRILQMWIIRPLLWFVSYFFFKTINSGAQTSIYCAVAEELKDVSGKYFKDCAMVECSDLAKDKKIAEELWKESEKLTELDKQ